MAPSAIPIYRTSISSPLHLPRTRPRGGSEPKQQQQNEECPRLNHRQSCSVLYYNDDYKSYVHDCSTPNEPIKEPWLIKPPREINSTLEAAEVYYYIRYRLKRYVTPRSKEFLQQYEIHLKDYLQHPDDLEKKSAVITMNSVLHSKAFLYKTSHFEIDSAAQAVEELAKLRYYADYGDYVGSLCTDFRNLCVQSKVENVDILLGKSWGQVLAEIKEEERKEKQFRESRPTAPIEEAPGMPVSSTIEMKNFIAVSATTLRAAIGTNLEPNCC
ncbi:MAG: hypothetical protein Q9180_006367 [Flavoplaca navasiana]